MQRICFGLALDGERGWHARDGLGKATVGPLGLLTSLETQLGLLRSEPSRSERVVQLRDCLRKAHTGARFYERSFEADEIGTAATLLDWRDAWYEHGWSGSGATSGCLRLDDMLAVETLARDTVSPGVGQRLQAAAAALRVRKPQIETVELVDPPDHHPASWRAVLDRLPAEARAVAARPAARPETMLHRLQTQVLGMLAKGAVQKTPWVEDGTVLLVRGDSMLATAEWLAAELREHPRTDRLIVAEQDGALLDAALAALDQPRHGVSESSIARPALGVLPLALRLLWEPLDFAALMQFLIHPIGPVRRYARGRLAEKMAAAPGIGGESWQRALVDIADHYGAEGPRVREDIALWLEQPRFRPAERAPLDTVLDRVSRMEDFFRLGQVGDDDVRRAAFQAGLIQCRAVHRALSLLRAQGEQRIGPESLERLVAQATGTGTAHPLTAAEAGAGARVRAPGAAIEPFAEVCWWAMKAVPLVAPYPWSPRERAALRVMGVDLPATERLLERQAQSWLRPVLSATERLILALPPEGEEAHPLWLTLAAVLERPVTHGAEDVLRQPPRDGALAAVPYRPLPRVRRWWRVPAGTIHGWERSASYSSLEQFFYSPWRWALQYPANLRPSALFELPGDFQLFGTLAHRAVERLYRQPDALSWPVEQTRAWFDVALEGILAEEGALLYMPGRGADRAALRMRVRRALGDLHRLLQDAGAVRVQPECHLKADTPLGPLEGSIDLLVTLADGRRVVIDMKWAGNGKYRKRLTAQTHIQLAIYARLVENGSSPWPQVAYFILKQPELLTTAEDVFRGVTPVRAPGGSAAMVWEQISATWRWRRAQIEAGEIEVALERVEPTPESAPPGGALPMEYLEERYNPFLRLAGWEDAS